MAKKDRSAILNHLKNLMIHIIKWNSQEDRRGSSWQQSINNSRDKISDIQKNKPSLNDEYLKKKWNDTFDKANKKAENEMQEKSKINNLTWTEVFINKYTLIGILGFLLVKFFL